MSAGYLLLVKHKVNLEDSLEGTDLMKLSKELLKRQIISKEFHDRVSSLDPDPDHLESDIKVRYLLQQVCERVKEDGNVFDRLVRVLARLGGEEVRVECEAMKKELKIEGRESASGTDKGGERCLVEQDVPYLVEVLVSGSYLWDTIGIALNLPKHKREDCGEGKENVNRLSNTLTTWIQGTYEGARPATLSSLREALASETVGLGKLVQDLSQFVFHIKEEGMVQEDYPIKPNIIFQTYDTEIAENKSTLLEVQVSGSGSESYQWNKDGEPLTNGTDFSGVCSNMLYINKSSQNTEGKYSCSVSRGSETVYSDDMSLSVIYSPEKKQLLEFYSVMKTEIPQDSWPPVGNSTFINLVLIEQKQKPVTAMSTCDYYTIRGDMDDILASKEVAEYEEVFREYKEGALVLVEGRPGSGKTTLVYKLTKDWASGKKVLQGAKMVFLVTLRLVDASGKDESLIKLLQIFYGRVKCESIENDLLESRGKGACFILDGLDEYDIKKKKNSVINQLLNKSILPLSMIIVASRPVATSNLKAICEPRIEVVGFSRDQIYSYVKSYPFDDSSSTMAHKMIEFLDQHPNVLHMCYLPVHASMICFLFSQLEGNVPHRETQIYEQFSIATLLRHEKLKEEKKQIKSLIDITGDLKKSFYSICGLAFDMIIRCRQVVNKSDDHVCFSNDSILGFLTIESTSKLYGDEDFYTFHHLTFQEFLAAFYVLTAHIKVNDLISSVGYAQIRNVIKFYGGLGGFNHSNCCRTILPYFKQDPFSIIQCAYESQRVELCDSLVYGGAIMLHDAVVTSTDFIALGYVISKTTKVVKKMSFRRSWWDNKGLKSLYLVADKNKIECIKYLTVGEANNKQFEALNHLLNHLPFIEELDLTEVTLDISTIECLTREVKLPHLRVLNLSLPNVTFSNPEKVLRLLAFGSQNVKKVSFIASGDAVNVTDWRATLVYAFENAVIQDSNPWIQLYNTDNIFRSLLQEGLSRCTDIFLVNCCIGDEGAKILANTLNTSVLANLVLDFNGISNLGAIALAGCLTRCSVVQEVSIQYNSIGDSGATALTEALVHSSSLNKLDLQGNNIDKRAVAIAKATGILSGLDLYFHSINFTQEGIEIVLENKGSTKIRSVVFFSTWDNISERGIDSLKQALCCIPALTLSSDNIGTFVELTD